MQLQKILQKLGLNGIEGKVYLACLETGAKPASLIAKKLSIRRPTIYGILDRLAQKGFITQYQQKDAKYFSATAPDHLLVVLEQKKKELNRDQRKLEEFMPNLTALTNSFVLNPHVRFYEGIKGIERVMEDTLTSKTSIACISSIDGWFKRDDTKKYMIRYVERRVKEKKIPIRIISFDTSLGRKYADEWCPDRENIEMTHNRWFPEHIQNFNNEINIYDNKVAIVSLGDQEHYGLIVESQEFADTMRVLFEFCWQKAGPSRWEN